MSLVTTDPAPMTLLSPMLTPGQTMTPPPSQNVVSEGDGERGLQLVAPGSGLQGVGRGEELHVRADLAVLSDGDRRHVQCGQVVIDEGPGPDGNVAAVVHVQRRPHLDLFTREAEQLVEERPGGGRIVQERGPVALGESHGALLPVGDLGIVGDVEVAREHALQIGARVVSKVVHRHAYDRTLQSVRPYTLAPRRVPSRPGAGAPYRQS